MNERRVQVTRGASSDILEAVLLRLEEFRQERELNDLCGVIHDCLPEVPGGRAFTYQALGSLLREGIGGETAFRAAESLFLAAADLINSGRSEEAEEPIVTALGFFSEAGRVEYELRARNALAMMNIRAGKTLEALEMYDESLEIATRNKMEKERARLLFSLGDFYRQNDSEDCLPYLRDSIELCRKIGNEEGLAFACSSLSRFERKTGNAAGGLEHAREALKHADASRVPGERAYFLLHYSTILSETGNTTEALERLDEAEKLLKPRRWKSTYISVLSRKMILLMDTGRLNEARADLETLQRNLTPEDIAHDNNRIYCEAMYRLSLEAGDHETALKHLEKKAEVEDDQRKERRRNLLAMAAETRKLEYARREKNLLTVKNTQLEQSNEKLNAALEEIKVLQSMLPICSSCGKARDEEGYWTQLREYMTRNLRTDFQETLCDKCRAKLEGQPPGDTGNEKPVI